MPYTFGTKHLDYMRRAYRSVVNVAEGAVRAGKTVDNVFVFAALLEHSPDKLHLATGSTLGNAKLNIGDCNGLGLEKIFENRCRWVRYRDNEALLISAEAGERIVIFAGGKNSDSYKKIRGNSYGMWIATEINLHSDGFIKEAFNRQLAARDRRVFWDLNPSSPSHFIYRDYIDKYAAQSGSGFYNYAHFTIRDNPLISEKRLSEIEAQYDKGTVWYRRDILGERCAAEGLIYRSFANDPSRYTVPPPSAGEIMFINIGADFGGNRSRTAYVAVAFMRGGSITVIGEHTVSGEKGEVDSERINREMRSFLTRIRADYGGAEIRYIFCDSEAQYLISGMRKYLRASGESAAVVDAAKKPIADRIAYINSMISQGRFALVHGLKAVAAGLAFAVWDDSSASDRRKDDFTSDIDILDALEYATERYMMKK